MNRFIFKTYFFDSKTSTAHFHYGFEDGREFIETVEFEAHTIVGEVLDRALFLAFVLIGVSYYKAFPSHEVVLEYPLDDWQANFFSRVYQEGLGQFAFENQLTRKDLARFQSTSNASQKGVAYRGSGSLVLQSGGKDSLLLAAMLKEQQQEFTGWYVTSSTSYPQILTRINAPVAIAKRSIDHAALRTAAQDGAKNGHVPVTYIIQSLAVVQAILLGKSDILTAIAHEGEEPDHVIDDLVVTHQWSKTWQAEVAFAEYVTRYISPDIRIGSPLRSYSELHVARLFSDRAWKEYGHSFSSCNTANYRQGHVNDSLAWCGRCPKCANSYLLFAPFIEGSELKHLFNDEDLFTVSALQETFKGLLGVDGVAKPFECIGEVEELRLAYHLALKRGDYQPLSFDVPKSSFVETTRYDMQSWLTQVLQ